MKIHVTERILLSSEEIDSMHCITYALKRKERKPLLFKQTLRLRFKCLAYQYLCNIGYG